MTRVEKERLLAEIEKQYKWLMTKSPTIYMMDIAFDAIRKAVRDEASKEQQEPRWIPVEKKAPVAFEKVLVTYRLHHDDSIHIGIGNTISDISGKYYWNINEQDYIGWDILAWMPLPEPFEPQKSEDKK